MSTKPHSATSAALKEVAVHPPLAANDEGDVLMENGVEMQRWAEQLEELRRLERMGDLMKEAQRLTLSGEGEAEFFIRMQLSFLEAYVAAKAARTREAMDV